MRKNSKATFISDFASASGGDAFVSTTISTNDTGRQGQHFFIVNAV